MKKSDFEHGTDSGISLMNACIAFPGDCTNVANDNDTGSVSKHDEN